MKSLLILFLIFCTSIHTWSQTVEVTKSSGECHSMSYTFTVGTSGFTVAGGSDAYVWEVNGYPCTTCPAIPVPYYLSIPSGSHSEGTVITCKVKSTTGAVYTGTYTIHYEKQDTPLYVGIAVNPQRYPPLYCSDEVSFTATINPIGTTASYSWYRNNNSVASGQTYDPAAFYNTDVIEVRASTNDNCISPKSATYTLNLANHSFYMIDKPVEVFSVMTSGNISSRCAGPGVTMFYSNATNYKSQQWSVSPANAGTIAWSESTSYQATVTWSSSFTGTATITATAIGCVNQLSIQKTFPVLPAPAPPQSLAIEHCNFEPVIINKSQVASNTATCKWYDGNENLLNTSDEINLSLLSDGSHIYKVKTVDNSGCESIQFGTINLSVGAFTDCDQKLNTIEAIGYDAFGNEVSHSKSYFDLSGKLLQSQTRSYTTGEVFTSEVIKDQFERPVISTLAAPIGHDFQYQYNFATTTDGKRYDYNSIGQPMGNTKPGTVGYYYSENNSGYYSTPELVPVTSYPYSQNDYYTDGTGEARRSTQAGEVHRMGLGHESFSGTFPIYSELNDYLQKRLVVFPGIAQPTTLQNAGVLTVVRDENDKFAVSLADKSGKVLMSARPCAENEKVLEVTNLVRSIGDASSQLPGYEYRMITYFCILTEQPVQLTGTGNYVVEDLLNDQVFTPPPSGQNWPIGFYRVVLGNENSNVSVEYKNYFKDISYQFYDDAGRLVSSVSPNGVIQWNAATPYEEIDHSNYKYNFRGWLMEMKETDAGTTKYKYRNDGKIRFSQNASQNENELGNEVGKGKFSYTNYDYLGRPTESGEYIGAELFANQNLKLELTNQTDYVTDDKKDWIKTYYDDSDPEFPLSGVYVQEYIRGAVSSTQNANIKTWYSYDEFGRVTWMAQKPTALARVFVVTYKYDFLGNVLTVANLSYSADGNKNLLSEFYHHYEYDPDQRLYKAYTSLLPDGEKKLRATYTYYRHGPLKRIELGDQAQGIDFVYNINGWLTQINHPDPAQDPGGDTNDVFGMILDYYQSDLTNLFSADISNKLDPHQIHGDINSMLAQKQSPLIRFIPAHDQIGVDYFKSMSAGNKMYQHLIFQQLQSATN